MDSRQKVERPYWPWAPLKKNLEMFMPRKISIEVSCEKIKLNIPVATWKRASFFKHLKRSQCSCLNWVKSPISFFGKFKTVYETKPIESQSFFKIIPFISCSSSLNTFRKCSASTTSSFSEILACNTRSVSQWFRRHFYGHTENSTLWYCYTPRPAIGIKTYRTSFFPGPFSSNNKTFSAIRIAAAHVW